MTETELLTFYDKMLAKERDRSSELAGALGAMACLVDKAAEYMTNQEWKQQLLEEENMILKGVNHERR